ncbi:DMT family transporter [Basilea psittacipulmonis]|uniref:RhaT protein n=1 Tax=Basilea psittacipulmonis DSM 24701 TaxID=1072685 RepID=A0A077DF41_9BURK|nr:DMT family transporter [Basilea psittacipulmonis]AIL32726.1 RhaT protein [Basilea psittacipulmonis DSM 24701]
MKTKYYGEIILFITTIAAALGWLFSKHAIAGLSAVAFVSLRFCFAGLIFLPFALPQMRQMNRKQWKNALLVGITFSFYLFFWVLGVKYSTELGKGAFLLSVAMLISPMVAWLFFRQIPSKPFWYAFPIAILGIYFLANTQGKGSFALDSVFFLLAAIFAAIQFVLNNRYTQHVPVLALTTIQLLMVGLLNGMYSLIVEPIPTHVAFDTWLWLLLSVLIGTNARFLLQTLGQKHSDIGHAAIIMILEPVWTLLLSVIFMSEILNSGKILGIGLILVALIFFRLSHFIKVRNKVCS